jgi:hypothetical protein
LKERDHLKDEAVDGRIILKCIAKKGYKFVNWAGRVS